ncbi:MAG: CapA family protein, partial [Ilumatobacteraceae bacterium]
MMVALLGALVTPTVADAPTLELAASGAAAMVPAERAAPPGTRVTWGFTGDIHTLRTVNASALQRNGTYDYAPKFARVAPLLSWFDVASCHMEAPVAPPGTPILVDAPLLSTAPSLATALAGAGYD